MKKILGVLLIMVFLLVPMGVFASPFLTHTMDVNASSPNAFGWSGDYDVVVNPVGGLTEVFCIENAAMWDNPVTKYDFYTINVENVNDKYTQLSEAVWYANWFVNVSGGSEYEKVSAQVAVWNAMGVAIGNSGYGLADELMIDYLLNGNDDYVSDWAIAVSPSGTPIEWGQPGQNFLVQNTVPEPATMFLLGMGLLGIAGIGRKHNKIIK